MNVIVPSPNADVGDHGAIGDEAREVAFHHRAFDGAPPFESVALELECDFVVVAAHGEMLCVHDGSLCRPVSHRILL
jgi:hypothetical protein